MSRPRRPSPRRRLAWALALVVGSVLLAQAQLLVLAQVPDATRFRIEYRAQEVESGQLIQAVRDFGRNGWDVYAVVPIWHKGDGPLPRTCRVLGRKPLPGTS